MGAQLISNPILHTFLPPKSVRSRCIDQIYHPNIQYDGKICLNILREDWKPVLTLNSVMVGLQYLLLEPNADDPLNKEAAEDLRSNRVVFGKNVRNSIQGGSINGVQYDNVLTK